MATMLNVTEAKARLTELVRHSDEEDVLLTRHGHPAAVLISSRRYDALLEDMADLQDRLAVHEREGLTISLEKLEAELGLNGVD